MLKKTSLSVVALVTGVTILLLTILVSCRSSSPADADTSSLGAQYAESFSDSQSTSSDSSEQSSDSQPSESTQPVSQPSSIPSSAVTQPTRSASPSEIRGVWISFLEYQSILANRSQADFINKIGTYFDQCVSAGFNTVFVHVRSHGDAYYNSSVFPTSVYFTGTRKNNAPYDPLSIMVRLAHAKGLQIHAWVNPYRGPETSSTLAPSDPFAMWQGTDLVFKYTVQEKELFFLNPGEPEVRNLVVRGIAELVSNYDIDGVHFDDYFYPTTDTQIDAATYAKYGAGRTLTKFRTDSVTELVKAVYNTVKTRKNIPFGISPAGTKSYTTKKCYADVDLWGSTAGYVDYLAPQLYWNYNDAQLPYLTALDTWKKTVTNPRVKLIIGLAAYRAGHLPDWQEGNILARQVLDARGVSGYSGFILFRHEYIFDAQGATELQNLKNILK